MANLRVDKITSTETFETTGSVQFDGTDDHLNLTSSDIAFGTGDFTLECWVYFSSKDGGSDSIMETRSSTSASDGFLFSRFQTSGHEDKIELYTDGDYKVTADVTTPDNTWVHVAVVRQSGTTRIYVNGTASSSTYIDSNNYSNDDLIIGENVSNQTLDGFISNFRMVKGTAVYTSNFKPPMRELEVVPGTVLLACQSKTDASLEKTGKTVTVNGNAVANELTPGLLTPIPKAGGGSAITGSVEFGGTFDHMTITENNDFDFGADDFTMEYWYNEGNDARTERRVLYIYDSNPAIIIGHTNDNGGQLFFSAYKSNNTLLSGGVIRTASDSNPTGKRNYWRHVAACREGATFRFFLDGVLQNTANFGTDVIRGDQNTLYIGKDPQNNTTTRHFRGFISNLRIVKGTALYTGDFIPPTRELKRVPGTVLLCCQDPDDPTQEVTGKTISLNGIYTYDTVVNSGITTAPTPSNFTPQVGDDRKVTFDGVTKINSDAYFYLPTGDTVTRDTGSGRGLFGGGDPSRTNAIDYIQIQSTGNALDFGDLIEARDKVGAGGNRTRGIWAGGDPSSNTISYVTIATRGNAENFGDLSYDGWGTGAAANTTRWLAMGGWNMDHISYVTISSLGDAQDFGDLLYDEYYYKASGSPTRCLIFHRDAGQDIQFVTWSSTGNATSFGEMTSATQGNSGTCSDPTRVIRFGGRDSPGGNNINMINYVTISSLGDEQDFGDLTSVSNDGDAVSNSIRGAHHIGTTGSVTNAVDYVTIQTTGNAQDFGDLTRGRLRFGTASDSQGAIA